MATSIQDALVQASVVVKPNGGSVEVAPLLDAPTDGAHLIVQLTQESYDDLTSAVDRAGTRGLTDSFDYWLAKAIETGLRTITRVWDASDENRDNKRTAELIELVKKGDKAAALKFAKKFNIKIGA